MRLNPVPLALLAVALPAAAQQRDSLPRLTPQDVEIRGEVRVSLPSIERQPITGLAPGAEPRRLDPRRAPWSEGYVAGPLPATPLGRPAPPPLAALDPPPARRGLVDVGFGPQLNRFGRLYLAGALGPRVGAFGSVGYDGTNGHRVDDVRAPFGRLTGRVGGRAGLRGARLDVVADVYRLDHRLFALAANPERTHAGGTVALAVEGARGGFTGRARLAPSAVYVRDGACTDGPTTDEACTARESRLAFDGAAAVVPAGAALGVYGRAALGLGRQTRTTTDDVRTADAAVGVRLAGARGAADVGVALLAASGGRARRVVSLDADLHFHPVPAFELFAVNRPRVEAGALADLFDASPYLTGPRVTEPGVVPVAARAGLRLGRGALGVEAWGGFERGNDLRYFVSPAEGVVTAALADREVVRAGLDGRVALLRGLHVGAGVEYRDASFAEDVLTGGDVVLALAGDAVPYVSSVSTTLHAGYRLPQARGVVQAALTLEGARRPAYAASAGDLGPALDLDVYAALALTPTLNLLVRFDDVRFGARERWWGYPDAGARLMAGLGIRW